MMPRPRLSSFPGTVACSTCALLLFLLALVQHGRLASAESCQCYTGLPAFSNQIMGCMSMGDGQPCPPPVRKTKEPLFNATLMWDVKGVKAALPAGANVNGMSQSEWIKGMTPLQAALMTTSDPYWHPYTESVYAVMQVILAAGANPNTPFPKGNYEGVTPLLWAAYDGRTDLVNMMIKLGAKLDAKNPNGNTALHEAAVCDFRLSWDYRAEATVKLLLAHGANLNATNKEGRTPFQVTPGYPKCEGKANDSSDCPRVCKVLRDGLSAADKEAILAGQMPDDKSRTARKCCKDPKINDVDYSQCCIEQQGLPSMTKAGRTSGRRF